MEVPLYWTSVDRAPLTAPHVYRVAHRYATAPYHSRYLPTYNRIVNHPLPTLPIRNHTPPPPSEPPPPPGSILTALPWLIKELTGELYGLPVLDPHDKEATAPIVRPTTPPPRPPSLPPSPPPIRTLIPVVEFHPIQSPPTIRYILPSWTGIRIPVRTTPATIVRETRPELDLVDWFQQGRRQVPGTRRKIIMNRTGGIAVSDPAAPSLKNTVSWSNPGIIDGSSSRVTSSSVPGEDLPPIKIPILSENLFSELL